MTDGLPGPDRSGRPRAHHPARRRAPDGGTGDRRGADRRPGAGAGPRGRDSRALPPAGAAGGAVADRRTPDQKGCSSRTVGARGHHGAAGGPRRAATPIEATLVRWMEKHELFSVQRHQPGRITWEPTGGFQAAYRRAVGAGGDGKRPIMLATGRRRCPPPCWSWSRGTATSRSPRRPGRRAPSRSAGAPRSCPPGAVGTGVLAVGRRGAARAADSRLPSPWGSATSSLRRYGPVVARIQLGLERALDQLEHGSRAERMLPTGPPRLLDLLADEVRKALKS